MSANYITAGSEQTIQILSQTEVADVEAIAIYTQPSNVRLTVYVPLLAFKAGHEAAYLNTPAMWIEQLLAGGIVTAAVQYQDTDASRLLAGYVRLTVSYVSPNAAQGVFRAYVSVPMTTLQLADPFSAPLEGGTVDSVIKATYDRLVTLAGGPASAKL